MTPRKGVDAADFDVSFAGLRAILAPYARALAVVRDGPTELSLDTRHVLPNGRPLFFAAVRATKSYVAFHLMPVYVFPELLASATPALRRRMQGKSCFNFRRPAPELHGELAELTERGYRAFATAGYVPG